MRDGQMTLGELTQALKKCDPSAQVEYAFGGLSPTGFGSYRGDYSHLALGFELPGYQSQPLTVADLIAKCEEANGATYEGYKGGDFQMSDRTPIWIANYGKATGTALIGVLDGEYIVRLETAYRDY